MLQERIDFITLTIDEIVKGSGYPVPLTAIRSAKLAEKSQIKKLVRKGTLTEVKVLTNGTLYTAVYASEVPKSIQEQLED